MRPHACHGFAIALALGASAMAVAGVTPMGRDAHAAEPRAAARVSASDDEIARWSARVARFPDDAEPLARLGEAFGQKARETADPGYYGRAEAAFDKALALHPGHADALIGLAWVAGARHEFGRSAEWARRALALDPTRPSAHGLLGDAALEQGEYDAALEHYQRMLDLRPDLASYSRAAQLLFVTGDARKAIWMMGKAVAAGAPYAENTAWARAQLALMLWHMGALLPAEQLLARALADAPDSPHLRVAMGRVAASRGDQRAAIEHLRRAVALAPRIDAVAALGDLLAAAGEAEEAERQYALVEVIARLQRAAGVRGDLELASFYADRGRNLEWAIEEAEAIYRVRRTVQAADTLAWSYYQAGRYEDAQRLIAEALRRRTPDARILYHAGMIHARLGDRHHAQRYLYQALSLNPRFHPRDAGRAAAALRELGAAP